MRRPNILLLLSDEHSHRFMGHMPVAAGGEPIVTPAFDRLAAQGTVFTDAYCQMPLCTPSRLCLLTGRHVRGAGAWTNESVLRPELPTLPGTLRDAGYATCLVGKMHLGGTQQYVGFQDRPYGDLTGKTGHQWEPIDNLPYATSMRARTEHVGATQLPESLIQDQVTAHEAVAWAREQAGRAPDQPWFLCCGFSRPHFPLTAPERHRRCYPPDGITEPRVPAGGDAYDHPMSVGMRRGFQTDAIDHDEMMRARAAYFACVSYLDEVIGDLLLRLEAGGLLDETLVVYTSDHGELAGEHGQWWKHGWYEGCTRVPLIVSSPAQRRGQQPAGRCGTPVGLVDLFPSLCSYAEVTAPAGLEGADLSVTLRGQAGAPDRPVLCDALTPRWGPGTEFRMIRWRRWKYVRFRDCSPLAFDLVADPGEQRDLLRCPQDAETAGALRYLAGLAEDSMDFEAAERDRTVRDGALSATYVQGARYPYGNLYRLPDGRVVGADDTLYQPTVVDPDGRALFGEGCQEQNPT